MLYKIIRFLGNRYAGFILTMVVIINLAIGSLVMNMHADLYPPFFPFNLNFFFQPVDPVHSWLYALLVTFTLFGINLFFCLIESIIRLVNSRTGRRKQIAALLMHLALFLTMMAHLQDGFEGSTEQIMITTHAAKLTGIGSVRAIAVNNIPHPDGSLKDTEATLLFELQDGQTLEQRIAYNEPAIFDSGMREVIIQGGDNQPAGIVLIRQSDKQEIRLEPSAPYSTAEGTMALMGVYQSQMGMLIGQLRWRTKAGDQGNYMMVLDQKAGMHSKFILADQTYQYKEIFTAPVVGVQARYNPSIPLIFNALFFSIIGLILMYRQPESKKYGPKTDSVTT